MVAAGVEEKIAPNQNLGIPADFAVRHSSLDICPAKSHSGSITALKRFHDASSTTATQRLPPFASFAPACTPTLPHPLTNTRLPTTPLQRSRQWPPVQTLQRTGWRYNWSPVSLGPTPNFLPRRWPDQRRHRWRLPVQPRTSARFRSPSVQHHLTWYRRSAGAAIRRTSPTRIPRQDITG